MKHNGLLYGTQFYGSLSGKPCLILKIAKQDSEKATDQHPDEITKELQEHPHRRILIAGNEPMFVQPYLVKILSKIKGKEICIRTEGIIMPELELKKIVHWWYIRPEFRDRAKGVTFSTDSVVVYRAMSNAYFEFNVASESNWISVMKFVRNYGLMPERVNIIPHCKGIDNLRNLTASLMEKCATQRYNLTPPFIPPLWGKRRK